MDIRGQTQGLHGDAMAVLSAVTQAEDGVAARRSGGEGREENSQRRQRMGEVRLGVGKRSPEWRAIKGPPL